MPQLKRNPSRETRNRQKSHRLRHDIPDGFRVAKFPIRRPRWAKLYHEK